MDLNERKEIAGLSPTSGEFGNMVAAGKFKLAIRENDLHLTNALNLIPLNGPVSRMQYLKYIEEFKKAFPRGGGGIATATRLLAMKRPDIFVCINGGNRKRLCLAFGARADLGLEQYWDTIIAPNGGFGLSYQE
jgi:hypothetical protein